MDVIPFNRPSFAGNEQAYISKAILSGHASGNGPYTKQCQALLEQTIGVAKALLTTSCTDALEMTALLLNIKPGDEVIVPSFTFVSTVNAYVLRGAKPVFIDIRPDTLNTDERILERYITLRTKAIVVVHYAGVGCEMEAIMATAARHGIPVVEDNAHGLFATYRGKQLGTFGSLATQSFHETKNFTCGEGGALLINDPGFTERSEILWEKGTDRSRFFRGLVDKYSWVDIGSSFLPSDLLAAFLLAQLEARDAIQSRRREIWNYYFSHLQEWGAEQQVVLPTVPAYCKQSYHMFYLLLPSLSYRQALIDHLKAHNIQSVFHYLPLHLSDMGRKFGGSMGDCPVTEDISDRLLRLPFFYSLTTKEQQRIVAAIQEFEGM